MMKLVTSIVSGKLPGDGTALAVALQLRFVDAGA